MDQEPVALIAVTRVVDVAVHAELDDRARLDSQRCAFLDGDVTAAVLTDAVYLTALKGVIRSETFPHKNERFIFCGRMKRHYGRQHEDTKQNSHDPFFHKAFLLHV